MHTNLLQNIGLTHNQAHIYAILLERGSLSASNIQRRVQINRSLVYVVLEDLISLDLVTRDDSKKIARFFAGSPNALLKLVQEKEAESQMASSAYKTAFHQLQQAFEIQSGQPGVRFFAGAAGLKQFYDKLNNDKPDTIYIIRSTQVESNTEMEKVVLDQIDKQIELGIKVHVITPTLESLPQRLPFDKERLVERRVIDRAVFDTGSQIIIYNETIAHTTYREPTVTTVIEHGDISQTMLAMFTFIWRKSLAETQTNIKKLTEKAP